MKTSLIIVVVAFILSAAEKDMNPFPSTYSQSTSYPGNNIKSISDNIGRFTATSLQGRSPIVNDALKQFDDDYETLHPLSNTLKEWHLNNSTSRETISSKLTGENTLSALISGKVYLLQN